MSLIKITTKGRYALRMMVDLAEQESRNYISLKDVAGRQDISKKYLEQIVPALTQAGLLSTVRGPTGGYRLARPSEDITVGDILRVTEGSFTHVSCVGVPGSCERSGSCPTITIWQGLSEVVGRYLDGITLRNIVEHQKESYTNTWVI
ncbi:MAG: RrF2 family transcriptional regulator [Sutterella sp.]